MNDHLDLLFLAETWYQDQDRRRRERCFVASTTDPDATMDMSRKVESHMPSDRPGMIMRKRILQLLRENGEDEVSEAVPAVSVAMAPTLTPHESLV